MPTLESQLTEKYATRKAKAEARAKAASGPAEQLSSPKACNKCGEMFVPSHEHKVFCSTNCRITFYKNKNRQSPHQKARRNEYRTKYSKEAVTARGVLRFIKSIHPRLYAGIMKLYQEDKAKKAEMKEASLQLNSVKAEVKDPETDSEGSFHAEMETEYYPQ